MTTWTYCYSIHVHLRVSVPGCRVSHLELELPGCLLLLHLLLLALQVQKILLGRNRSAMRAHLGLCSPI